MKRLVGSLLVFVLMFIIVACGSDDEDDAAEAVTVENATTCEQLMDLFIPAVQTMLDASSDVSMDELMGSGDTPEFLADFESTVEEIGAKSDEIGCESAEMQTLFDARVDDLTAEGAVGEFLLSSIKEIEFD